MHSQKSDKQTKVKLSFALLYFAELTAVPAWPAGDFYRAVHGLSCAPVVVGLASRPTPGKAAECRHGDSKGDNGPRGVGGGERISLSILRAARSARFRRGAD